MGQKRSSRIPL